MHLLLATGLYPPEIGGPATYSKELVDGLPERGIEISLLKYSDVRYFPRLVRHYMYYRRVCEALRSADMVLALDPVSVGIPSALAARRMGKPFVVKIVGDYAWEQGVQRFGVTQNLDEFVKTKQRNLFVCILQKLQLRVAKAATRVLVPSDYLKDVVTQWGIPEGNIVVINNAIRIPENIPQQKKEEEKFLIVSAGRRVPWKGFEAIERVAKNHPHWSVKIISGRPREEVLGWIKAADVFVLNSEYEGFPHIIVEAMTLGTPVVVSNIQANISIVGDAGLTVKLKDDTSLEEALMNVEQNPADAERRAQAGKQRMKMYQPSSMLDRTAEFLQSL